MEDVELCTMCGDPFDPHILIATGDSPIAGGVMICPVQGCRCSATWAPSWVDRDTVQTLSAEELDYLQTHFQRLKGKP